MKKIGLSIVFSLIIGQIFAYNSDTLLIQDFEVIPATPTWNYSGTPYEIISGSSSPTAAPPNSPIGIGGSNAWHVRSVSGGNQLTFDNFLIPSGFDSTSLIFRLAAMNLENSVGGPDNLDYVLVEISINGGAFYPRVRVRGAENNNSFWPYTASGIAEVSYLPAVEALFQPVNSGLQTTFGYSTVKINFPPSVNQVSIRITPRSSSLSDSWLIVPIRATPYCPIIIDLLILVKNKYAGKIQKRADCCMA